MRILRPLLELLDNRPLGRVLLSQIPNPALLASLFPYAKDIAYIHCRRSVCRQITDPALHVSTVAFPTDCGYDLGLLELPTGRDFARAAIFKALESLRPGASLYVFGEVRSGIRPIESDFAAVTSVHPIASGSGARIFRLDRTDLPPTAPPDWNRPWEPRPLDLTARNNAYRVFTQAGIFSWQDLDDGTAFLFEHFDKIAPAQRILDACCGYGIIGLVAQREWSAKPAFADDDILATTCTRLAALDAPVHLADLTAETPSRNFDLILCNPPFHQGRSEDRTFVQAFLHRAREMLAPQGRLVLVANKFLPYAREVESVFSRTETLAADRRYQILSAARP